MSQKIFLSGLIKSKDWRKETEEFCDRVRRDLGEHVCDLVLFFVTESYKNFDAKVFSSLLHEKLGCRVSIGCNANGIISNDREVEAQPAISLLAAHLPQVKIMPFYVSEDDLVNLKTSPELINLLDIYPTDKPNFLCLADPATCDITKMITLLNEGYKEAPVIGGLSSGNITGGNNWLALDGAVYSEGLVGLALAGNIAFDVIVSQGCRPIAQPFVITRCEQNALVELAGRPALDVIRDVVNALPSKDRKLAEHSLFVGVAMNEHLTEFKRGDFLIRNIVGFDPEKGTLSIGAIPKIGQTIQFQLRDAETSSEDLQILLGKLKNLPHTTPQGALLVSCSGRGQGLYGVADYDAKMIQSMIGPLPLAGFFANGEIGPVGAKNFVHGYTSSLVIFK